MHDALVIGAGPNGLVAAATLARHGWSVLLVEAQPRPGGAVYSEQFTLPGYWHDVGAAFFPFAEHSPAFRALDLEGAGLRWACARRESSHPALDGTCPTIARDPELSAATFGADGPAWLRLAHWQQKMGARLPEALLAPLPAMRAAWRLGPWNIARFGLAGIRSTAGCARHFFQTEAARRVLPALALHVDLGPSDLGGAGLGLTLALLAAGSGFRVPVGGARSITQALLSRFEQSGGELRLGTRVVRIQRRDSALVAHTQGNEEICVRQAVLADVGAPALFLKLLGESEIGVLARASVKRFRYGWGTFKMDWALSSPVPWRAEPARESAVVHTGESIDDLQTFTDEVRAGKLPTRPYLVIGQQSLADSSRAPAGGHTLWAYSRVPSQLEGGWPAHREAFADRIEERVEGLSPGFRSLIRGRAIFAPPDLEAMNENLVGGDLGGGSAHLDHQLFFRPTLLYHSYRTPVKGVYLCSASAPPGAGVHGACGFNAAQQALRDCKAAIIFSSSLSLE